MSYTPPQASKDLLDSIDFGLAIEFLQKWKSRFDAADAGPASEDPSKCKGLFQFPDGTLFYEAKAAICAVGSKFAADIDATGQSTTSVPLAGGPNPVYFDATVIPYVVLPKAGFEDEAHIPIRSLGVVIYQGRVCPVIYCDRGPDMKIGEISIHAHELLGNDPWGNAAHTRIKNASIPSSVLYFIFPGSEITHPRLTVANAAALIKERALARWENFKTTTGSIPVAIPVPEDLLDIDGHVAPMAVRELQERLSVAGLYDCGAIDGEGGPFTDWALKEFKKIAGTSGEPGLDGKTIAALRTDKDWLPLTPGADLAGRIVSSMLEEKYWICRHEQCFNIVYVEGMDTNGKDIGNKKNQFNDARILIGIRGGVPVIIGIWDGSTEPSKLWTEHPMNIAGAARIQFGQYYSWRVGDYHGQPALRQTHDIVICRDLDKNFKREGDKVYTGKFVMHHHWGYDYPVDDMKDSGAGCLIGRSKSGHLKFMKLVKSDPRYLASNGYRFTTAVLPVSEVKSAI